MAENFYKQNGSYYTTSGKRVADLNELKSLASSGGREVSLPTAPVDTSIAGSTPSGVERPGAYGLSDWRSYQGLKDAAAKIIEMKNAGNKDITEASAYWKGISKQSAPFGGTTGGLSTGQFTDARLRELSPAEQASVRASREATASGALSALSDERRSREEMTGTAMQNISDISESQRKAKADEDERAYKNAYLKLQQQQAGLNPYGEGEYIEEGLDIDKFASAISGQESDGDSTAENSRTGAYGTFQILPSNWPSWSNAYATNVLKKSIYLPQNAENQEKVAKYKMQEYYDKYGNWQDVASMWYSGRPFSKVVAEGWADKKQGPSGKEPSVREYVDSVMSRMGAKKQTLTSGIEQAANPFSDNDLENYAYNLNIGNKAGDIVVTKEDLKGWTAQEIMDALRVVKQSGSTGSAFN